MASRQQRLLAVVAVALGQKAAEAAEGRASLCCTCQQRCPPLFTWKLVTVTSGPVAELQRREGEAGPRDSVAGARGVWAGGKRCCRASPTDTLG